MTEPGMGPGTVQTQVEVRRARILGTLARPASAVASGAEPTRPDRMEYLLREAQELYWEELAWEELTDEELIAGGHLTELVFPAFLAFVDGLLLEEVAAGARAPARPRPDVVERILTFLGQRYAIFTRQLETGADSQRLIWARAMTGRLIDLILFRLYRLTPEEREEVDAGE